MKVACRLLEPPDVLPLRSAVLRPGWRPEDCVYTNDYMPRTFHAGAVDPEGNVVGIVSFHEELYAPQADLAALRFQGMAVDSALQGQGIGSQLLSWALDHARRLGRYDLVWCNARTPALDFYRRLGFESVGEEFITDWGPHYLMYCHL
jgi:GNAT superfamily N-acetyltransferase